MVQSERNASRLHPKIIATELQRATLGMDMSENEVKQHDLSELELLKALEERVFEIMNAAVLNVRMTKMPLYSNFHSYEHLRKIKSKVEAADAANAIAAEIAPYGSCLFMANECYKAFKADLLAEKGPEYAEFARRVEYATESWDQNPKSSREMHCVAMLRLWDHCIVFDPVSCGYAIKVPVGQVTKKLAAEYQFCYAAVNEYNCYLVRYPPNGGEIRNLLAHPILKHNFSYSGPYMSIKGGFEGAVANLAWPTASYIGRLPSRRFVQIQQTWERQPSYPEFSHFALPDGIR
ncbi:hypothetical protein CC86DRAFT_386738 [Ophiobolus disseminans]|uniref:Uncharacterized protein n=1 Tax=Ophiobolus disseminans TaxID=1469910 RepID=A0A6A6ZJP3_9PLEO|nr:hypothetical protein CC86DRAFT_386738 [Ophiobolus disseminans]